MLKLGVIKVAKAIFPVAVLGLFLSGEPLRWISEAAPLSFLAKKPRMDIAGVVLM